MRTLSATLTLVLFAPLLTAPQCDGPGAPVEGVLAVPSAPFRANSDCEFLVEERAHFGLRAQIDGDFRASELGSTIMLGGDGFMPDDTTLSADRVDVGGGGRCRGDRPAGAALA